MLVYLHGFNSSPLSSKALQLTAYCAQNGVHCIVPQLHHSPKFAASQIAKIIGDGESHTLVGSSMGGYYATWFCENFAHCRAVLVNPATKLADKLADCVGKTQQNYHTDERYLFDDAHLREFRDLEIAAIKHPQKYLLMVQSGDEVLDYREAVQFYDGAEMTVEDGGDHSFVGFAKHLPRIVAFAAAAGN